MTNENPTRTHKILWIDEDGHILEPYLEFLEANGYKVEMCDNLSKGEKLVQSEKFDLVILDVMITPTEEEEKNAYTTEAADLGMQSGLVFFKRVKSYLEKSKTPLLVLTQRIGLEIRDKFVAEGLPQSAFARKSDLPTVRHVLEKLEEILAGK